MKSALSLFCVAALLCGAARSQSPAADAAWPTYGGDPGGQRYSPTSQINKTNVDRLKPAWTFHTGVLAPGTSTAAHVGAFEATPILFKGSLYFTSPFDQVFSLDPETGVQRWKYDTQLDWTQELGILTSRGVAAWSDTKAAAPQSPCADRIFAGTLDGRLLALDAATGQPCAHFGNQGSVDLKVDVDYRKGEQYAVTSPPTVVGDIVVVGSGIADNVRVDVELGVVRGFDARSGKLRWTWDPIPWAKNQTLRTGAGNTWGVIAADLEHGIVYLPTSSASPDYYGGLRPGDDRDADSIVALDAATGRKIWAFQVVHHNIWDYDIAAEPLLFTFRGTTPAVAVTTKMGLVFVLNRLTGEPLYKVTERPVPQSDVPGEVTSPTQPFPDLPPLNPITLDMSKPLGVDAAGDTDCRHLASGLRYEGIYTPPSLKGSILFPSNLGGVNWGSAALDPATGILYANTNHLPFIMTLEPRSRFSSAMRTDALLCGIVLIVILLLTAGWKTGRFTGLAAAIFLVLLVAVLAYLNRSAVRGMVIRTPWIRTSGRLASHFGKEIGPDEGAPYTLVRQPMIARAARPCSPLPWGTISALNLTTGQSAWQTPLGTEIPGMQTGSWSVGGPIVTAGGLVFTAATVEPYLRAFDSTSGKEVWKGLLPVPAQATPMTYVVHGKQYIVVSAGGHPGLGTSHGDSVVAFSLP